MTTEEWAKDFKSFVNELQMPRDDYKGIMGYIDDALVLLKEQNWVKCSDRMPEEHETIFAKLKGTDKWNKFMFEKMSDDVRVVEVFEDGTRLVFHSYTIDGKWENERSNTIRKNSKITHWMPNPELPGEV